MLTDREMAAIGRRLLRPYGIAPECPYLSEDQRELSTLDLKGRSEWMGEWLLLADSHHGHLSPRRSAGRAAGHRRA
jgi:hypothetical protein